MKNANRTDATRTDVTRITLFALFCLLTVPTLAQAGHACAEATWIEPGEVVRGLGQAAGEPDCYRLATPGPGLLMLDVTVPAGATAEPLLTLADAGCGFGKSRKLGSLAATPPRQLVRVANPRDFLVCVGAQDPLLRLDDFRLETAFLAVAKDEPIEVEPEGHAFRWRASGATYEPIEVEPEGQRSGSCTFNEKDEPIEVEPEGHAFRWRASGATYELIEVEPEGLTLRPDALAALCHEAQRDEHADLLACATHMDLGQGIGGEIHNPWGDDQDVFTFELTVAATVRLWLAGEAEVHAALHDSRGQRLAMARGTEAGASTLRRVRTLGPGVYFVRVQGWRGAEGAYELEISTLPRSW